jgi:hypothetical protein
VFIARSLARACGLRVRLDRAALGPAATTSTGRCNGSILRRPLSMIAQTNLWTS